MARAADTFRWVGGTTDHEDEWNQPGNWIKLDGTAWTTHYPNYDGNLAIGINGDTVLLDSATDYPLAGYTADTGALAAFRVTRDYNQAIGSSGSHLRIATQSTGSVTIDSQLGGEMWIEGNGTVYNVSVNGARTNPVHLSGTINNLECRQGTISLESATVTGRLLVGHLVGSLKADVTIDANCILPSVVEIEQGSLTSQKEITTLQVSYGIANIYKAVTTIYNTGGMLSWYGGNITTVHLYAGQLKASSDDVKTITTLYVSTVATVDLNDGAGNSEATNIYATNGKMTINVAPGQKLTMS